MALRGGRGGPTERRLERERGNKSVWKLRRLIQFLNNLPSSSLDCICREHTDRAGGGRKEGKGLPILASREKGRRGPPTKKTFVSSLSPPPMLNG